MIKINTYQGFFANEDGYKLLSFKKFIRRRINFKVLNKIRNKN